MSLSFKRYPFLTELGLQEDNLGVFNGKWFGSGSVHTCISPIDNQPVARVTQVFTACAALIRQGKQRRL
jgi:hypothetical protein